MCSLDRLASFYTLVQRLDNVSGSCNRLPSSFISFRLTILLPLQLLQGVLGIKVKIMLDWDPKGKQGPTTPLPDLVTIHPPKEEDEYGTRPSLVATDIPVDVA